MSAQPIPPGYHTVTPVITCKDTRTSIAFYQRAFGAKELMVVPRPDGGVMHAEIRIGTSPVMLSDEMPGCPAVDPQKGSPIGFYLYVEQVDAVFAQATKAGATVTMPVADMFWGDRCGAVQDPFGVTWTLATHIKDPTPAEMQKGQEAFLASMAAGKA
jgi:uncharacterized glyoxalase superfamily protein PhnB